RLTLIVCVGLATPFVPAVPVPEIVTEYEPVGVPGVTTGGGGGVTVLLDPPQPIRKKVMASASTRSTLHRFCFFVKPPARNIPNTPIPFKLASNIAELLPLGFPCWSTLERRREDVVAAFVVIVSVTVWEFSPSRVTCDGWKLQLVSEGKPAGQLKVIVPL